MSANTQRKFVTYLFEITDEAAFMKSGNPMNPECKDVQLPGLTCLGVSIGDLMAVSDDFAEAAPSAYAESYDRNVTACLRAREERK